MTGRDDLHLWWELSYATFLTLPRILMQEMPDDWQQRMAQLLNEYNETWDTSHLNCGTTVRLTDPSGKLIKCHPWLLNYRHPDQAKIEECRRNADGLS